MSFAADTARRPVASALGTFERYLTLWVALCIIVGIVLGRLVPGPFQALGRMSLAEVNTLSGQRFARWDDVDPPRSFPLQAKDGRAAFWNDPWAHEWETFRRHLVHLHYDELCVGERVHQEHVIAWQRHTKIENGRLHQ